MNEPLTQTEKEAFAKAYNELVGEQRDEPNPAKYLRQRCIGYSINFQKTYWECEAIMHDGTTATFYEITREDGIEVGARWERPEVARPLP